MPEAHPAPEPQPTPPPAPRLLCDVQALAALPSAPAGALWRLAEPGRQLDANVVHMPPGRYVDTHTEPDLDVLLLVVAGDGTLEPGGSAPEAGDGTVRLAGGALCWLPHGSTRRLTAGAEGLTYVTVHRRRPGMRIRPRPDGDA
jgi:quercetin dioxygenase-like cupin family protein